MTPDQAKQMLPVIDKFEAAMSSDKISVCELGSCQYETANHLYDYILATHKIGGLDLVKEILNCDFELMSLEQFEHDLYNLIQPDILDQENEDTEAYATWLNNPLKDKERITIDDYYEICRNLAYDLWSAMVFPTIGDIKYTDGHGPLQMPVYGPILNQMCQSENFNTGFAIALTSIAYGTDISVFSDFDT